MSDGFGRQIECKEFPKLDMISEVITHVEKRRSYASGVHVSDDYGDYTVSPPISYSKHSSPVKETRRRIQLSHGGLLDHRRLEHFFDDGLEQFLLPADGAALRRATAAFHNTDVAGFRARRGSITP